MADRRQQRTDRNAPPGAPPQSRAGRRIQDPAPPPQQRQEEASTPFVPVTFKRMDWSTTPPQQVEETRHLYFTMGSFKRLYEALEIDEEEVRARFQKAQDADEEAPLDVTDLEADLRGEEEADEGEGEDDRAAQMVTPGDVDGMVSLIWAGLLAEASGRGEELTREQVGHWLDGENTKRIAGAAGVALQRFLQGQDVKEALAEQEGNAEAKKGAAGAAR